MSRPRRTHLAKGILNDIDALLPSEMARRAETVGEAKAALGLGRLFALGVLGGAFIALGAAVSAAVTAGDGLAPGFTRVLGGLTFSVGLVLVVGLTAWFVHLRSRATAE